jgi:low affinity Fe/Cu permease
MNARVLCQVGFWPCFSLTSSIAKKVGFNRLAELRATCTTRIAELVSYNFYVILSAFTTFIGRQGETWALTKITQVYLFLKKH